MAPLKFIVKFKAFLAASCAGLIVALYLPAQGLKNTGEELIAMFGLVMAGVLPTMVLTASALRAGNMSARRVTDYARALDRQLNVWVGLFIISLAACLAVIAGSVNGWALLLDWQVLPTLRVQYDFIHIVNGFVVACGVLLALRSLAFGRGVRSLLKLTAEIAISEAKARDDEKTKEAREAIAAIPARPGFGEYVDLPQ
jgi:hypothetical protein